MNRFPLKTALCLTLLCFCGEWNTLAQTPLGVVVANLPVSGKMVADPFRPRVYMLQRSENRVLSIDTATLTVVGSLPTGIGPTDLAITPDGDLLYVSTAAPTEAVDLIGLDDFVEYNSFALPTGIDHIAAGVGGRIFVSKFSFGNAIDQLDGATGEQQAAYSQPPLSTTYYDQMRTTPDGKTLVASTLAYTGRANLNLLGRFDVSRKKAVKAKDSAALSGYFALSHDGKRVAVGALPNGLNPNPAYAETFSINDFNTSLGFYRLPSVAGPVAFSGDDRVIYQTLSSGVFGAAYDPNAKPVYGNVVYLYDADTVALLDTLPLPPVAENSTDTHSGSVAVDETGSYLFVGQTGTAPNGKTTVRTLVIGTGRGSGLPTERTIVGIAATTPEATAGSGGAAAFTLTRGGDFSQPLTVSFKIAGSAVNGVDYTKLPGTKKIAAGKASVVIRVTPAQDIGSMPKTVTLSLKPDSAYDIQENAQATVTLLPRE